MKIRTLRANEIECRVQSISVRDGIPTGAVILLYKDARVDQRILDEVFGTLNWQREHQLIGDRLYCTVSVWDGDKKQWISKQDVGTESNTEKEKGQASDSFKRACFNIGIGRELYSAPFTFIQAKDMNIVKKGSTFTTYDHFSVVEIDYNKEREISYLTIKNDKTNKIVYRFGNKVQGKPDTVPNYRNELIQKLKEKGIDLNTFAKQHKLNANTPQDKFKELIKELG